MVARKENSLGEIIIASEVLATLAGISAMKCYGIVGMASKRARDGIVELLGMENLSRGVKISGDNDEVVVDLFIIVEYGVSIAAVARNVMETVKYNIENYTGMKVKKVNINVEGIRVEPLFRQRRYKRWHKS